MRYTVNIKINRTLYIEDAIDQDDAICKAYATIIDLMHQGSKHIVIEAIRTEEIK